MNPYFPIKFEIIALSHIEYLQKTIRLVCNKGQHLIADLYVLSN